jgi:hypothetical protein
MSCVINHLLGCRKYTHWLYFLMCRLSRRVLRRLPLDRHVAAPPLRLNERTVTSSAKVHSGLHERPFRYSLSRNRCYSANDTAEDPIVRPCPTLLIAAAQTIGCSFTRDASAQDEFARDASARDAFAHDAFARDDAFADAVGPASPRFAPNVDRPSPDVVVPYGFIPRQTDTAAAVRISAGSTAAASPGLGTVAADDGRGVTQPVAAVKPATDPPH